MKIFYDEIYHKIIYPIIVLLYEFFNHNIKYLDWILGKKWNKLSSFYSYSL